MSEAQAADPIPEAPADEEVADKARALALLAREDERQTKLHDLLETIREQIRVEVAPEHRPAGLMQNIQNAVYAMRGRTALMNDAAITNALRRSTETDKPGVREAALEEAAKVAYSNPHYVSNPRDVDGHGLLLPGSPYDRGRYDASRAIRALSASPLTEGCRCQCCGALFRSDLLVSDEVWAKISPSPIGGDKGGGLLCPTCIVDRMVGAGITTAAYVSPSPLTEEQPVAAVTPRLDTVRAHKHTCANVQPGSTYADKCDCGALDTAGQAIPRSTTGGAK